MKSCQKTAVGHKEPETVQGCLIDNTDVAVSKIKA